jgi:hypothetical protein
VVVVLGGGVVVVVVVEDVPASVAGAAVTALESALLAELGSTVASVCVCVRPGGGVGCEAVVFAGFFVAAAAMVAFLAATGFFAFTGAFTSTG